MGKVPPNVARTLVNALVATPPSRPHMAVRTDAGFSLLREA